jgi:hypothetical protein
MISEAEQYSVTPEIFQANHLNLKIMEDKIRYQTN